MKITYISHATLLIETGYSIIVTDPWVGGSAYCNQWYLYPKALRPELIKNADYLLYSHGHEDHLHTESLQTINKKVEILYPYSWYGGSKDFFKEVGYNNVKEVLNEKTIVLDKHTCVTYLSNNLDNVMVIECNGKVLVNINDALPSASTQLIEYFISKIKQRWPRIDYVFSSYGGASYFPNTVHCQSKNDKEIAEVREQFFVNNFCKIIDGLQPALAVPFASDFVLLDDHQRWINESKFPRNKIKEYYNSYSQNPGQSEIIEAYPDDFFDTDGFHKTSPYHKIFEEKGFLGYIDTAYEKEIAQKRKPIFISESAAGELIEKVKKHILNKAYIIPENVRKNICFTIKITDANKNNYLKTNFRNKITEFEISSEPGKHDDLLIEIKSQTLHYTLDNEWGGDAIIIGYGVEVHCYNEDVISKEYENYCIRLLSRYPNTKEYLLKTPWRGLKYLMSDSVKRKNIIDKILGKSENILNYSDTRLANRNLWLNKSKCDVCKACNIN